MKNNLINFYDNKIMNDEKRQDYENFYAAIYELMIDKIDEIIPLMTELDMKELTIHENKILSYKYKDDDD